MLQQTNEQTAAKPAPEAKSEYVTTIREGAIGANIFLANKKDGSQGHYFKLSRSYKGEGQTEFKYSENFYPRNSEAIAKVTTDAAKRCDELDKTLQQ